MSKLPPQTRVAEIIADTRWKTPHNQNERVLVLDPVERAGVDKEAMTADFSFASEAPVDRWYGREILSVDEQSCDLTRLNNGGAFLVGHDWGDQVGVVTKAWIDSATKKARCTVMFSQSTRGKEIFDDIARGIRRLVSVGYVVRKMQLTEQSDEGETFRVTDWQAFEVSTVPVPADPSVGQGRSKPEASETRIQPTSKMSETTSTTEQKPVDHLARQKEIRDAAKVLTERNPQHKEAITALRDRCCFDTNDNVDAFNRAFLNDILATKQDVAPMRQIAADVGLSRKDIKRYSLMRAIRAKLENKPLDGLEGECNTELSRKLERQPIGFFMPDEIAADRRQAHRTLYATSPLDGGFTVPEQQLASEFVSFLRSNAKVVQLGARVISGLQGNITIPRQLTGTTVYWVSETGSITASSATFGQIAAVPRRIGTSVPYTKQFIAQTSLDAESFVVNDSDAATAADLDRVAIRGTGGNEPLGILNLASGDLSTAVSFSGAATWVKYLEFFKNVADSKALFGSPAYLTSPASAVKAMSIPKFSSTSMPIWDENSKIGMFRAEWSNNIATSGGGTLNQVIFGDFSQVLFLEWAGRDVVVDPYGSNATSGTVTITIQRLIDCVIRRGKSFAISSDTGAT